ncbi:MAG: hypothetical protein ABFD07_18210 [Methanobacterium sp.]
MKNDDIDYIIGQFEASFIKKIDFDIFYRKISIDLVIYKGEIIEKHCIVFENVSAFFFENNTTERRFNVLPWENAMISEIHYFEKPEDRIIYHSDKPDFPEYIANVNYFIEIWSSLFLIEAKSIVVDGIKYMT